MKPNFFGDDQKELEKKYDAQSEIKRLTNIVDQQHDENERLKRNLQTLRRALTIMTPSRTCNREWMRKHEPDQTA